MQSKIGEMRSSKGATSLVDPTNEPILITDQTGGSPILSQTVKAGNKRQLLDSTLGKETEVDMNLTMSDKDSLMYTKDSHALKSTLVSQARHAPTEKDSLRYTKDSQALHEPLVSL